MFTAVLFTISKAWEPLKCPLVDWTDKYGKCIYILRYYSALKRNEIRQFAATWMYLEITILSEVTQKGKDKYHDIAYMWNLKKWYKWTYIQNKNRSTDTDSKVFASKGESRGVNLETRIKICVLLYRI